jgi:hypothetical protein
MASHELFGRKWRVTIGPPGGTGRSWSDLDIRFLVEKSGASTPNKLKLSIFNLSKDSQQFIEKKGMAVIVEAGYGGEFGQIFTGSLELASHEKGGNHGQKKGERLKDGPDWLTEIDGLDGAKAWRTVMHESFAPGKTEAEVLRAIAKKMGLTLGTLKGLSDEPFRQGRQLSGAARFQLDALCRSRKLRWSMQDGVLQVLRLGASTGSEAVLLTPETGLVGSPERTETGLRLTSLLRPSINPGQLVKVKSQDIDGLYVVECLKHEGDSAGQPWYTHMDVIKGT